MFMTKDQATTEIRHAIKDKATILFYNEQMGRNSYLKKEDNPVWKVELKRFRKLVKEGKMEVNVHNNKDKTFEGKNFYQIVVQLLDKDDLGGMSPMAAMGFGELVSGWAYYFSRKGDRDAMFKYLSK